MMRSAISPRFAIRIFLNIRYTRYEPRRHGDEVKQIQNLRVLVSPWPVAVNEVTNSSWLDGKEALAVLHGVAVFHVRLDNLPVTFGIDLVHQLHRLDDTENLAFLDGLTYLDIRLGTRLCRPVEGSNDWRLHDSKIDVVISRRQHRQLGGVC